MRVRLLLVPLLLTASACTGGGEIDGGPDPTPTEVNPCEGASPAPGCVTATPADPTAFPYPADAGQISPLPVPEEFDGELVRRTNNLTPGVKTATFKVTVPAGKALATDLICQGKGKVVVTTQPDSLAEITMSCDGNDIPSQLGVVEPKGTAAARTFTYTLTATGPARWFVAVSARTP